MAQREPVHVQDRFAGHLALLQHTLDEQVLAAVLAAAEQLRAISDGGVRHRHPERPVPQPAQLAEQTVARQRQLEPFRAVEAEQERPRAALPQLGEQHLVLSGGRAW